MAAVWPSLSRGASHGRHGRRGPPVSWRRDRLFFDRLGPAAAKSHDAVDSVVPIESTTSASIDRRYRRFAPLTPHCSQRRCEDDRSAPREFRGMRMSRPQIPRPLSAAPREEEARSGKIAWKRFGDENRQCPRRRPSLESRFAYPFSLRLPLGSGGELQCPWPLACPDRRQRGRLLVDFFCHQVRLEALQRHSRTFQLVVASPIPSLLRANGNVNVRLGIAAGG
jgi:hypothetical protein